TARAAVDPEAARYRRTDPQNAKGQTEAEEMKKLAKVLRVMMLIAVVLGIGADTAQSKLLTNRLLGNRLMANRLMANRLMANRLATNRLGLVALSATNAGDLLATADGRNVLSY